MKLFIPSLVLGIVATLDHRHGSVVAAGATADHTTVTMSTGENAKNVSGSGNCAAGNSKNIVDENWVHFFLLQLPRCILVDSQRGATFSSFISHPFALITHPRHSSVFTRSSRLAQQLVFLVLFVVVCWLLLLLMGLKSLLLLMLPVLY